MADGATLSFDAGSWARQLVHIFCRDPNPINTTLFKRKNWESWLNHAQQQWADHLKNQPIGRAQDRAKWFYRNAVKKGATGAATFVGLELDQKTNTWHAMIIGDCCLFHLSSDVETYPIRNSQDFNYHPDNFPSKDLPANPPQILDGRYQPGDHFMIATDAMAKWMLSAEETGRNWVQILAGIHTQDQFAAFVEQKRRDTELENDDTSLLVVSPGQPLIHWHGRNSPNTPHAVGPISQNRSKHTSEEDINPLKRDAIRMPHASKPNYEQSPPNRKRSQSIQAWYLASATFLLFIGMVGWNISNHQSRLEQLEARGAPKLEGHVKELEEVLKTLEPNNLVASVQDMFDRIDALERDFTIVKSNNPTVEVQDLKHRINALEQAIKIAKSNNPTTAVQAMQRRINTLEQSVAKMRTNPSEEALQDLQRRIQTLEQSSGSQPQGTVSKLDKAQSPALPPPESTPLADSAPKEEATKKPTPKKQTPKGKIQLKQKIPIFWDEKCTQPIGDLNPTANPNIRQLEDPQNLLLLVWAAKTPNVQVTAAEADQEYIILVVDKGGPSSIRTNPDLSETSKIGNPIKGRQKFPIRKSEKGKQHTWYQFELSCFIRKQDVEQLETVAKNPG